MSLKERLFGPAWESKDLETRLRAVTASRDPRMAEVLADIARGDTDPEVRLAALRRMGEEQEWLSARARETEPALLMAADQAISRLACNRPGGDLVDPRRSWLKSLDNADTLRHLARKALDPELRRDALARIQSQGFLGDCLIDESDDTIADELIARIDQVSTLKRVAKPLRGKRKQRHQAVMHRLAELEGTQGSHAARDELATQLIHQAEQLARGEFAGDRKTELARLEGEWQTLPDPDESQARRFNGVLAIVRRALDPAPRPAAAPPPEPKPESTHPELQPLVDQAQQLATRAATDKTGVEVSAMISAFDKAWNALKTKRPVDEAARAHFMALAGELQARQQTLSDSTSRAQPKKAAPSASDRSGGGAEDTEHDQSREALKQALEAADQALAGGDVHEAHAAIGKARSAHDRLPKRQQPRDVAGRLGRMAGKLKEMRDWQHWSNNKLRERLIERAGEIDAANLHPDAVTDRLKELRERWKELDRQEVMPGEKRRFAAPRGQWRRFQKACNDAFEAARPYLEKRTEVRQESLKELEAFLTQAGALIEDDDADRETLIRHQRAAREAIRNLDALPPRSRGRMAGKLRELMDAISARLDRHFDAIADQKRKLIAEARKLEHEKDRAVAIDRAKALQAEWKRVGPSRRKLDDQLWREFREPIDPLFEDLKAERDQQRAAEKEQNEAIARVCEQAEKLREGDLSALETSAGRLAGLEEEFGRHPRIPPALRKRFERAVTEFQNRIDSLRQAEARAATAHLETLAGEVQQCWTQLEAGKPADPPESTPEIADDDPVGQHLLARLGRITGADDADALKDDVESFSDQARQVVIEMECLSGVETPEHDRKQRMDYQIQRLSSRLGEGAPRPDLSAERDALRRRWLETFPHAPDQHDELARRFAAADKILDQMTAD